MKQTILIVEDDQPNLDVMEMLIRKLGYEPVLISNGLEALEYVNKNPPSLILLDIMMTPIDGWVFLERFRNNAAMKNIPVIIFSAAPEVEERMTHIRDPCLGVLHKPVSLNELKDAILRFLPRS